MTRLLIVDDETSVRYTLRAVFEAEGYEVAEAEDGSAALAAARRALPDVVLTDLAMPTMDGMALLRELRQIDTTLPVVMLTAQGSERRAVEAMKQGAWDYLTKPFDIDEVVLTVANAVERFAVTKQRDELRAQAGLSRPIIYRSDAMGRLLTLVHRAASRDVTVLVRGETGTGKELVATALHELSPRARRAFVRFNVATLTATLAESELFGHERGAFTGATRRHEGLFERANGGTLFLDEIGEMASDLQAKLLRVLQEGEILPVGGTRPIRVDVRVVAATHRDLKAEVAAGRFREDLYYRLNVVQLHIPPLRERREDIAPLVAHLFRRQCERFEIEDLTLAPEVVAWLVANEWQGNIRELENALARLAALSDGSSVTVADLCVLQDDDAQAGEAAQSLRDKVQAFEASLIRDALARNEGNRSAAARELSVSRVTLLDKIAKYGLG
jgi:DNA-binding NtrC family response regulator